MLWAFAMSVTMYAGAMQYVAVELLASGVSLLSAAFTTLMVNARHLFYAIAMLPKYQSAGKAKPYLSFATTDETFSLLSSTEVPEGLRPTPFRLWVSALNHSYWITGCVFGNWLGSALPWDFSGLEFSMTALFVAAFTEQWFQKEKRIPAMVGLGGTALCRIVIGEEHFLIPAMLLISLILLLWKEEEGQDA